MIKFDDLFKLNMAKRLLNAALIFSVIAVIILIVSKFDHGNKLELSFYTMKTNKLNDNIRVAVVADLHLREFGKGNSILLEKLEELSPDIIAVPGDIMTYGKTDFTVAFDLIKNMKKIAPVYMSLGNHEYSDIVLRKGSTLRRDLIRAGAHIVNKSSEDVSVKSSTISIGGISAKPKNFHQPIYDFLDKYEKSDNFKLLLCHQPECFLSVMNDYPVDLAISGHAHGGQIRLPVIGAIYAPGQGLFPRLTQGIRKTKNDTSLVVSRGLGNSHNLPRFNNTPEIVIVDIQCY